MTVKELLERMDSRELTEWFVYYTLEPFGEERADVRQAIASCTMANLWTKQRHKINDFMPVFKKARKTGERQTTEEMKALLMSIGKVKGS